MTAEKSVRIIAVGDIFLGEHPVTLGHGVTSIAREYGCDFLFQEVIDHLKGGDIVCGNLEGIISAKLENEKGITQAIFRGDPGCAQALKNAGFNCLFLANNHTAQHGRDALARTCDLLDSNNIKWTGYNASGAGKPTPAIFQANGLKVGALAYCEDQQYHLDQPILPLIHLKGIKKDIRDLKTKCDCVMVSLHWGDEFIDYPSPSQVDLARQLIDSGANLILGHHSHTMQGIEHYKNGLIVYSLGSFIKDLWPLKLRESAILTCEISPAGARCVEILPIIIDKKFHRPKIHSGRAGERLLARIGKLSSDIDKLTAIDVATFNKKYLRDVQKLLVRDRIGTLLHYLQNLYRYDKEILFENIKLIIKRRVSGKNI